ncbi:hypothetical protein [Planctomycetes bacterium Poly30]
MLYAPRPLTLLTLALAVSPAWSSPVAPMTQVGQATPLAPFIGEQFEGFESQSTQFGGQHPPTGAPCLLGGAFGGTASICATSFPNLIQIHDATLSPYCGSMHRSGNRQFGAFLSSFSLVMGADQVALGGYFASDTIDPQVPDSRLWEVVFLDDLGIELDRRLLQLQGPCGAYEWHGWTLPTGTRRLDFEIVTTFRSLLIDDLMISAVTPIGDAHCESEETSLRERGFCSATGSTSAAANQLRLRAWQLPENTFGFFLTSRGAGMVPAAGGSAGTLCLGGAIGRYVGPGQIKNSGTARAFELDLDLAAMPQPNGAVPVVAGETWHFQAWFRDVEPGPAMTPTSNFTGGLRITFD